jgi:hypothetical protein
MSLSPDHAYSATHNYSRLQKSIRWGSPSPTWYPSKEGSSSSPHHAYFVTRNYSCLQNSIWWSSCSTNQWSKSPGWHTVGVWNLIKGPFTPSISPEFYNLTVRWGPPTWYPNKDCRSGFATLLREPLQEQPAVVL